jgi:poly-D-alanine transfer protein DltD
MTDAGFLETLDRAAEWTDLDILLHGLSELGVEPILLTQPLPGTYYDYVGVSYAARQAFYTRLRSAASPFGVPVVDFANHDYDLYFVNDPNSHLSRKGWVYYAQALDAFFHGALDQLDAEEWSTGPLLPGDSARADPALRGW